MTSRKDIALTDLVVEIERRGRRLDSNLEAEGAEFLVLGLLLVEGIQATKAYTRFPGYDLLAFNAEAGRTCRIQVKSRWATDYNKAFPIRKFECDFVVHVALNRGYRHRRKIQLDGRQPPKIYVLPIEVVRKTQDPNSSWGMVHLKNVPNVEQYVDRWSLIRNFLRLPES